MTFSTGETLTKTKGLKSISYVDFKALVQSPVKLPVTAFQYSEMDPAERGELKKGQKYFITSDAKTRSDKAVKSAGLNAVVIDLDSTSLTIDEIGAKLTGHQVNSFMVYTSLSHTNSQPRYRVVVPLASTAKAERWQVVTRYLNDVLFADSDDCSKTMAQAWLLPVITADGDYSFKISDTGEPLDIHDDEHLLVREALDFDALMVEAEDAEPATFREFEIADGELSPVFEFNKARELRSYMRQLGFKFKSKNRAVHPNSGSGSAGIFIFPEGERAFSHHGSDLLCGKSFDAFDLFVHFEHGGDLKAAVKAASDSIVTSEGITVSEHNRKAFGERKAYKSIPSLNWDDFLGGESLNDNNAIKVTKAEYDIAPPPEHCFEFSGIAKDIYDNIIQSAIYPQPSFALAATLMILSMIGRGRLTGTQTHVRSNMMFICTGESGCGKQHNINKVDEVTRLVNPKLSDNVQNKFASGPAFWSFLANKSPEVLLLSDECGFLFNTIKNGKADYLAQLYDCFLQGYSASCSVLKSTVYSDTERNTFGMIEYPHICLMGFTTAGTLADALTHEDSSTGLIPRLLFFPAVYDVPEKQPYNPIRFDDRSMEGFKLAYNFTNWKGPLPYTRKYPLHVPTTPEAEELLNQFGQENREEMRRAESMERNLLNRAEENARRLSLLYWMDCVPPTDGEGKFTSEHMIQVEHVQKAIDLVKWSLAYTLSFMTDQAGATITSKEVDRLVSFISQAKEYGKKRQGDLFDRHRASLEKGLMPRAILVKLSKKSAKNLDELLETAAAMEAIGKITEPESGKLCYVATKGLNRGNV
ncbi:DUF3987 domain-containing protein [Photobacterium rosenbergii]|uniref:DUF3987 domain-containing protein n=1 Tax=Photobacterium rosenbergii TaxID=294936 RepID=UPI001C9A1F0F|nr:DUF3987 domain-containing protein [Photobacterium rosenbergii]MBY5948779.1 DUF3987 domain-containing protein [Photobacterium rosenbergii]